MVDGTVRGFWGTQSPEAQAKKHVRPLHPVDVVWCSGQSEPGNRANALLGCWDEQYHGLGRKVSTANTLAYVMVSKVLLRVLSHGIVNPASLTSRADTLLTFQILETKAQRGQGTDQRFHGGSRARS